MKKLETVIKDLKQALEASKQYPEGDAIIIPSQDAQILLNAIELLTAEKPTGKDDIDYTTSVSDLPAPNTVMWWLCRIADDEVRRKAVGNCSRNEEHEKTTSVNEALAQAFVWEYKGMWHKLYGEEIPLLPEPDFTEYLELRK